MATCTLPLYDEAIDYPTATGLRLSKDMLELFASWPVGIKLVNEWDPKEGSPIYTLTGSHDAIVTVLEILDMVDDDIPITD